MTNVELSSLPLFFTRCMVPRFCVSECFRLEGGEGDTVTVYVNGGEGRESAVMGMLVSFQALVAKSMYNTQLSQGKNVFS